MELLMKLIRFLLGFFFKNPEEKFPELKESENRWKVTSKLLEEELNNEPKYIICNGEKTPIHWKKVVLWNENGGLRCKPSQYKKRSAFRTVKMFVVHWDACLHSKQMADVLEKRGLSVPFAIDNDGTIYQLMDTKHIAWHARGVNMQSVGVEIANAVELKYQDWYVKNGFGKRPVIKNFVLNGKKMPDFLGFYPVQIDALKALIKAVSGAHNIPLRTPKDKDGNLVAGADRKVAGRSFKGVVGHYHVSIAKADPAGLPLDKIVKEVRENKQ